MKSNSVLITLLAATLLLLTHQKPQLKFNALGKFKILQLTDIHLGEREDLDIRTLEVIRTVIEKEKPEMVFISGDAVSGYAWDKNTTGWFDYQFRKLERVLAEFKMPWAFTAGNHDAEGDYDRQQISNLIRSFENSVTLPNAGKLSHEFNYVLPVYSNDGKNIEFRLWSIDTGASYGCMGSHGYDCVRDDQIQWFRQANQNISSDDPTKGKAILFTHIPMHEYMNLYNYNDIFGLKGEEVCCPAVNTGLFSAIVEDKTVEWVTCGHDHNNDYHGTWEGIHLAYGRKTGYASYGPQSFLRGSRIFEITLNPYKIDTWIRQEDGTVDKKDGYTQKVLKATSQQYCCGLTVINNDESQSMKIAANLLLIIGALVISLS
ncbi:metallophosphoesterase [Stylonychia lemnae]|uniref:Metallophosphoesterase n=1 Tax=Stylonychia lemnae TaxID=5949 RepID=A0A078B0N5_STYLE|nr:metallophosphoesterase [Stylonychia lemnae]|eukprot:CDW88220.1 metallophosphoesterase [Stylonychia lemnae]